MNWKRVVLFVILLLVATAVAALLPFGFLRSYFSHTTGEIPFWVPLGQALAVPFATVIVFAVLGYLQRSRVTLHAAAVAACGWLVSFVNTVVLLKRPILLWFVGFVGTVVFVGIGTGVGVLVRKLGEGAATR